MRLIIWWHAWVLAHKQRMAHVSHGAWDIGAKGILVHCECGKMWAL